MAAPGVAAWKNEHYVTCYQLARSGLSNPQIARALGVTKMTFGRWVQAKPALRDALERGRKGREAGWRSYVYRRLSPLAEETWDDIMSVSGELDAAARIEAILEDNGEHIRQELFLHSLVENNFNSSAACRQVNISYGTLQRWKQDLGFLELMGEMRWHMGNYYEEGLVAAVGRGDAKAIIFANKTFNKDRGYSEKLEIDHNHQGQINHLHAVVDVDALDLPLEVRTAILEAVRKQKKAKEEQAIDVEVVGSVNGNGRALTWEDE